MGISTASETKPISSLHSQRSHISDRAHISRQEKRTYTSHASPPTRWCEPTWTPRVRITGKIGASGFASVPGPKPEQEPGPPSVPGDFEVAAEGDVPGGC
eukprot:1345301-Amorphochlora_amoeboformis.AAC.1